MAVVKQAVDVVAGDAPRVSASCSRPTSGPATPASSRAKVERVEQHLAE